MPPSRKRKFCFISFSTLRQAVRRAALRTPMGNSLGHCAPATVWRHHGGTAFETLSCPPLRVLPAGVLPVLLAPCLTNHARRSPGADGQTLASLLGQRAGFACAPATLASEAVPFRRACFINHHTSSSVELPWWIKAASASGPYPYTANKSWVAAEDFATLFTPQHRTGPAARSPLCISFLFFSFLVLSEGSCWHTRAL